MKIFVCSDIHDNEPRLKDALKIARANGIKTAICLGDVSRHETLGLLSEAFEKVFLALGNMDFKISRETGLFPENVEWFSEEGGQIELDGKKIFLVHYDFLARKAAESGKHDLVLYGHTHTPWEKKIKNTVLLNPGEISGQFGPASFAIYDLDKMKAELFILD